MAADSEASAKIERLLRLHEPLWVNGYEHVVVIAGIDGDRVKVYDPLPENAGKMNGP